MKKNLQLILLKLWWALWVWCTSKFIGCDEDLISTFKKERSKLPVMWLKTNKLETRQTRSLCTFKKRKEAKKESKLPVMWSKKQQAGDKTNRKPMSFKIFWYFSLRLVLFLPCAWPATKGQFYLQPWGHRNSFSETAI